MDVGAHQRKGVEGTPGGGNIVAELIDESLPIRLIGTEIASIYSPDNHVVQGARCVQAGVSRHEPILYFRQGSSVDTPSSFGLDSVRQHDYISIGFRAYVLNPSQPNS